MNIEYDLNINLRRNSRIVQSTHSNISDSIEFPGDTNGTLGIYSVIVRTQSLYFGWIHGRRKFFVLIVHHQSHRIYSLQP